MFLTKAINMYNNVIWPGKIKYQHFFGCYKKDKYL